MGWEVCKWRSRNEWPINPTTIRRPQHRGPSSLTTLGRLASARQQRFASWLAATPRPAVNTAAVSGMHTTCAPAQ
jgi:hypothetical protein